MVRLHLVIVSALGAALRAGAAWLLLVLRSRWAPAAAFGHSAPWEIVALAGLALAGTGAALGVLWKGGGPARAMGWLAAALGAILLVEALTYLGRRATQIPVAAFAADVRRLVGPDEPLVAHPDANLAFDFYLGRGIKEESDPARLARWLEQPARGGVLLREASLSEIPSTSQAGWCPQVRATLGARSYVLLGRCR